MIGKFKDKFLTPLKWLKEGMPLRGKIIIAILLLIIVVGSGVIAFKFYDFTQNNPKFCVSCHLMQPAFKAWQTGEHAKLNCHDCHHLSIVEQNKLLITFILKRPDAVPERHGKVIVPWKQCIKCHWERNEKYRNAPLVNRSTYHAKHVFVEQIECSKCHGYRTHVFTLEERYCLTCHKGKEVHGTGMEKLPCLNCHTDRTTDLRPGSKKCLFCHGGKAVRQELIADNTIDVKHFQPSLSTINKAKKINITEKSPMQFYCYGCHKPHEKVKMKPSNNDCLSKCHSDELLVGKHELHVKGMNMQCIECHKPHIWIVTEGQAKTDCVKCHEYKDPEKFLR